MAKTKIKQKMVMRRRLKEYCENSTMHGFRYLTEEGTHWSQKAAWGIIILLSFVCCVIMSDVTWNKYVTDPTVTMVETTTYPTTEIEFPAVTICSSYVVYLPNTNNITDILIKRGFKQSSIDYFYDVINYFGWTGNVEPLYLEMLGVLDKLGLSLKALANELSQPCETMLIRCWWRSGEQNCKDLFKRVITHHGYCCRFDIVHLSKTSSDTDLKLKAGFDKFRGLIFEVSQGVIRINGKLSSGSTKNSECLARELKAPPSVFEIIVPYKSQCVRKVASYVILNSVFVTGADRILTFDDDPITLSSGIEMNIGIEPSVMESSEEVKNLALETRQCLLINETVRGTPYISTGSGTYQSCVTFGYNYEILKKCQCTPAYLKEADPRKLWNGYSDCSARDIQCLKEIDVNVTDIISGLDKKYKCYSACDEISYEYSVNFVEKDVKESRPNTSLSTVSVYISERTCIKYRREVLFSWDQLLASLGGIFGLCLGGSIVSIVELIFLCVDLVITNLRGCRQRYTKKLSINSVEERINVFMIRNIGENPMFPSTEYIGKR